MHKRKSLVTVFGSGQAIVNVAASICVRPSKSKISCTLNHGSGSVCCMNSSGRHLSFRLVVCLQNSHWQKKMLSSGRHSNSLCHTRYGAIRSDSCRSPGARGRQYHMGRCSTSLFALSRISVAKNGIGHTQRSSQACSTPQTLSLVPEQAGRSGRQHIFHRLLLE